MTELNLLYGDEENINSISDIEKKDTAYSSKISGHQIHKMASQQDSSNDDIVSQQQQQQQQIQQMQQIQQIQQMQQKQKQQNEIKNQFQQSDNMYNQRRFEYTFLDRMNMKKSEVLKLALFSLVIVLGISIDRLSTYYISKYIGDNVLTDFQEFLLRFSYPIAIFLLLWTFKAL